MTPDSIIQATQSTPGEEPSDPATLLTRNVSSPSLPLSLKAFGGMAFTFKATASSNSEPRSPSGATEHSAPTPVSICSAALSNEDILALIFQEVDGSFCVEDLKKRNQSLLRAAQTSKAFFRPAVSALWRRIHSLVPLLTILPQFKASTESVHKLNVAVQTLVGQISDKDWARFEMYARSVRVLDLALPSETVGGDVYIQLARLHPDPLLPGLQRMNIPTIADGSTDTLAPLFHCISSTLLSVNIGSMDGPKAELLTTSFLSALSRDAVGLRYLSIDARISPEAIDILSKSPSVNNLQLSIYSAIPKSKFATLLGLPAVSSVTINFFGTGSLAGNLSGKAISQFQLKAMRISGNGDQIKQVFDTLLLIPCGLEDVDLFFQNASFTGILYAWQCAPRTLRRLKLETPHSTPLPELRLRDFSTYPSNIVALELKGFRLQATDDDILKICKTGHWRNLEKLYLPCFGIESPDSLSSPSINILGEISASCPKLCSLYICVDLRLHDHDKLRKALLANIGSRTPSHKLKGLEISSVRSPKKAAFHQGLVLAQYIDSVFPHLSSLAAYGNNDGEYWDEIWRTETLVTTEAISLQK
ncbi:hypothetical protein M413DRAFT_14092 [Hebeloma cylindrosporum]|uniref:F-box domain-containing protein n=1 Tax=Hebeloma cylindrosporum TaxID=76867 RepID=A0A0C3BXU6_HEBCY|nr:hypothetical protein M413DRAFT_14092 [Hebeloma cylindrosporum h7]